ncbi:hypothetical protein ACOSQ4_027164 [Xanthoceras sorbifolium]
MTKRPFTGKCLRAKEPLKLIHTDVCGSMNVRARGGYEYYVTFIDDYSRYGYVYLMQRKSETFKKFKEFRTEVENQLGKTIKSLQSDRVGENLDQEFKDFMVEYRIVSQLTASVPSKSVPKTPLELWNGRKVSLRHFRIWGCPAHVLKNRSGKLDSKSVVCLFVGYSKETRGGYFYSPEDNKVFVSKNATFLEDNYISDHKPRSKIVLYELEPGETSTPSTRVVDPQISESQMIHDRDTLPPRRSGRVVIQHERYLGIGEGQGVVSTDSVDDPLTFKNAMEDPDKGEWLKAMNLEMESMYSNSVWDLVDLPDEVKSIGCRWIYKRKRGVIGKVKTFKARLVAKVYTQKEGVDYEETFSPVAMFKSTRILLSIAVYFDYEIWQMDVKTAFLNGNLNEIIYIMQPEGFVSPDQEQKVCKLQRSIYGLKQASRSWNIKFDDVINTYGFEQNVDEPCVYKRVINKNIVFLFLYVDDILLIGNDVGVLSDVKGWLASQFQMKDLGEASYVVGIQLIRDRKNKLIALSQASYIDKILVRFSMQKSKKGNLPYRHGVHLSKEQCPKTPQDIEDMRRVPYASAVGSLMYAMLCTRPDICYAVGVVSRYQSNSRLDHWVAVKTILKYLQRTRNYMLMYSGQDLIPLGYTDSDFQLNMDSRKSTS